MTHFLFGWLLKGQMEVSFLDQLLGIVELIIVCFVGMIIFAWFGRNNKK